MSVPTTVGTFFAPQIQAAMAESLLIFERSDEPTSAASDKPHGRALQAVSCYIAISRTEHQMIRLLPISMAASMSAYFIVLTCGLGSGVVQSRVNLSLKHIEPACALKRFMET